MRRISKTIYYSIGIFVLFAISTLTSNIDFINAKNNTDKKSMITSNEKTVSTISSFDDFALWWDYDGINGTKTGNNISFLTTGICWSIYKYHLNISDIFSKDCTNADIEVTFNYDFGEYSGLVRFGFGTYYNNEGEFIPITSDNSYFAYTDLRNSDVRIGSAFDNGHRIYRSHNLGSQNSASFFIKRTRGFIHCGVKDNHGKVILSRRWFSYDFYLPASYLSIEYIASEIGATATFDSIAGSLTLQNRNWQPIVITLKIINSILITLAIVSFFFGAYKLDQYRDKKREQKRKELYAKLAQESDDEYLRRLEKALK